ncbi:MAG: SDR family NAD(P)-dependent oxidoreductase, partial [Caldilinea sp.]|nr:SDR family NAD(P)-dependent oxidoreductase [Caldilinea sp.]
MPTNQQASTVPQLAGKTCLVTGASRGLGVAIARRLAQAGARVAVHYRQAASAAGALCAELTAAGATALPFQADLLDAGASERLVAAVTAQLGAIDVLVNN